MRDLKPGQFVWYPERAEAGPVAIVVSLPDQLVYVYRDGIRIGVSTCATGRPGHATPTGVFTILQKDKTHHSSLYNDASMPFTERLTWSGVALHAGNLPGYPDSHGCVHLPLEFSKLLFGVTQLGTPVIIADAATAPAEVLHPGLLWNAAIEQDIQSVEPGAPRDCSWRRLRRAGQHPDQRREPGALRAPERRRGGHLAGHDQPIRRRLSAPTSSCSPARPAGRSAGMW